MFGKIARIASTVLPDFIISIVALTVSYPARVSGFVPEATVEGWMRGLLMAPRFCAHKCFIGRHVVFSGPNNIVFGEFVKIHPGSQIIAGSKGSVTIGSNSHVSRNSVLAGGGNISIGSHCKISSGVMIYSVSYDRKTKGQLRNAPVKKAPIVIGNDVHIGANVTILPGICIGDNVTIGANAVVTKNISDNCVVAGVPARQIDCNI